MVVIPGLAGDQPFVAAAVQEFGAGLALPGDAEAAEMRAAALAVLDNPAYRAEVRRRAEALTECGAPHAAGAVESLVGRNGSSLAAE